jgi:GNAT superfamily N-acetyltransferase
MNPRIEKLSRFHNLADFDCGTEALNLWLSKFALSNQAANSAQTYLGVVDDTVVGYFSLTAGQVDYADAPERLRKGLARHPIPVVFLARLAVDLAWQSRGVGRGLLREAISRTMQAAEIAGIRALAVHAKDVTARAFYSRFAFTSFHSNPLHMYTLTKDLRTLPLG